MCLMNFLINRKWLWIAKTEIINKVPFHVYSPTNTFNIYTIFQLKGDKLDTGKVLEEVKSMVQLAKKNGKEVDENKLKSEMEKCGNQGKYYCTWEYFSVSTSEEQKKTAEKQDIFWGTGDET